MTTTTYAQVIDGVVNALLTTNKQISTQVSDPANWLSTGSQNVQKGWLYVDGSFIDPSVDTPVDTTTPSSVQTAAYYANVGKAAANLAAQSANIAAQRAVAGPQGPQGAKGDKGDPGVQGAQGLIGAQGINGLQGEKGAKGDPGDISNLTSSAVITALGHDVPSNINPVVTGNLVVNPVDSGINGGRVTLLGSSGYANAVVDANAGNLRIVNSNGSPGLTFNLSSGVLTVPSVVASGGFTGALTGNASTATKLATARTIALTGDATGSLSFDGSANTSAVLTLAASGVAAGTYNGVTVDAKGRVTAAAIPNFISAVGTASSGGGVRLMNTGATSVTSANSWVLDVDTSNYLRMYRVNSSNGVVIPFNINQDGWASFTNPLVVATPTASAHATTKNYVDASPLNNINTVSNAWSGNAGVSTDELNLWGITLSATVRRICIWAYWDGANTSSTVTAVVGTVRLRDASGNDKGGQVLAVSRTANSDGGGGSGVFITDIPAGSAGWTCTFSVKKADTNGSYSVYSSEGRALVWTVPA